MNLNLENLIDVLAIANGSERNTQQQESEYQLKRWEILPGYHYLLQEVYLRQDLPLQVRWLAIICFKNGIEKYWRASKANAIRKEEKAQIRRRLFLLVDEKNNQLAVQNAHSTARIVRFDFPAEWPTLFEDIKKMLEESILIKNDLVATNNLLMMLNYIIKAISAIRIGRSRLAMQGKAPVIVPLLIKFYLKFFQEWTNTLNLSLMEVCFLCLKNLRRILPEVYEQPHKEQDVCEFLKITVDHLRALISEHEKYSSDLLERYVKCYSKIYYGMISNNPTSFVLLPCSREILQTFLTLLEQKAPEVYNSNEDNDFWETLALKGFSIFKKVISYVYKKGAVTLKQRNDKEEVNVALQLLRREFFTELVIEHLCDLLIRWYLKLKPSDLENWNYEPEEWCNEELSSSWEYQVRPCAENFFQDLISFFKDDLSDFILKDISSNLTSSNSSNDFLVKDASLCAFQLSAIPLADKVDFDALLNDLFIPEALKDDFAERKILKRRVCLIITEWLSVKCSPSSRIASYKFLTALLQPNDRLNDKVVRLTAVQTLRIMVDDWDFNKHDFQPFLKDFVALSVDMLNNYNLTESRLYILNTLSSIFDKCIPLVDRELLMSVCSVIPGYWNLSDAENESILKTSLLRLLRTIVKSLNEYSYETYSIVIPLIFACCSPESSNYSLLSEDGYELWLTMLQYAPVSNIPIEDLSKLFPLVQEGLVNSTEILPIILSIIRSYALIFPSLFASEEAIIIFKTIAGYLSNMRDDSFSVFYSLMDILMLSQWNQQKFIENVITSGLFNSMLSFVLDENQYVVSVNKIFTLFSRLMFRSSETFMEILFHIPFDANRLLSYWIERLPNNGIPRNKKINLMALLAVSKQFIPKRSSSLIQGFSSIVKTCLLHLEEINENPEGNCEIYANELPYDDINEYNYLDPTIKPHGEKIRYDALLKNDDPVYHTNLKSLLIDCLSCLKLELSENDFNQLISLQDKYCVEKLQALPI